MSVRVIVTDLRAARNPAHDLVNFVLIDSGRGAVQHHHFTAGQLVHHQLAHILVVAEEGVGVGEHHLLIDNPVLRHGVIQRAQHPHSVVLNEDAIQLMLFRHGGEKVGRQVGLVFHSLQIDVLPVEGRDVQLVHTFLALDDQRFFSRIELRAFHRLLDHVGLAALKEAGEKVNR